MRETRKIINISRLSLISEGTILRKEAGIYKFSLDHCLVLLTKKYQTPQQRQPFFQSKLYTTAGEFDTVLLEK